jgi:ABC-2 type transport system permease protein
MDGGMESWSGNDEGVCHRMGNLFWAELKREWILLRRYAAEAISGVIGLVIVFYGLFLSARYVAGPNVPLGDRLDTIVVGYVLWSLVLFILGDIAGSLQREAQTGTLEQVLLSPYRMSYLFLIRAIANLTIQLLLNLGILLAIMGLTGSRLTLAPVALLPLLTVLLGAYGLALGMGSVALLAKRVQQLLGVTQFLLLFLLTVPIETWAGPAQFLGMLLPMTPGAGLLRAILARGEGLDWLQWAIALANGGFYFGLGLLVFRWAERLAKRQGKLAGY